MKEKLKTKEKKKSPGISAGKGKQEDLPVNHALLDVIAPVGVQMQRNRFGMGELIGKTYTIIRYPATADYGWLSSLTNIPNTFCSITMLPLDTSIFIDSLRKNIQRSRGRAQSSNDPLEVSRAIREAEDSERTMIRMDQSGERMGLMKVAITAVGHDEKEFETACRMVESICSVNNCKTRGLAYLQKEGLEEVLPFYIPSAAVEQISGRPMPVGTMVGGFPMASSGLNDRKGWYFGRSTSGGIVILDIWMREGDRTNSNFVILGKPGQGKSTTVKRIIEMEFALGTEIVILDPENEYRELAKNLGGDLIDAGGGANGKINPLQIRTKPLEKDEDEEAILNGTFVPTESAGPLVWHIQTLETFFKMYIPTLSDMHMAFLKDALIDLYAEFHITWDTDVYDMPNEAFPIISDLYKLLIRKEKESKSDNQTDDAKIYHELSRLLKDAATGAHSFIWNGHTTIHSDNTLICLNTSNLTDASVNIQKTQYFNILSWCWQRVSGDRNKKVLLVCDEAYLMIDPNVPTCMAFLRNFSKRCRKYEGALALVSHSGVDFLDPAVKMYGQPLLDNATYKVIFGMDGQNLKELKDLYNFTEAETERLLAQRQREALTIVGSKRQFIEFKYPDTFIKRMGTAGGRG